MLNLLFLYSNLIEKGYDDVDIIFVCMYTISIELLCKEIFSSCIIINGLVVKSVVCNSYYRKPKTVLQRPTLA